MLLHAGHDLFTMYEENCLLLPSDLMSQNEIMLGKFQRDSEKFDEF